MYPTANSRRKKISVVAPLLDFLVAATMSGPVKVARVWMLETAVTWTGDMLGLSLKE